MQPRLLCAALALITTCATPAIANNHFRFSDEAQRAEREARESREDREDRIADKLSTPCRAELKNKKIMVIIGERRSNGIIYAEQRNYGRHYEAINQRLKALGLRTYTPEEIRRQIAQAEIEAQFRNDPDAALSASKRLGANFILRGLISSQAQRNPMMNVNQVSVSMGFTLTASDGRQVGTADARDASYAGADVSGMALTLVNEQADEIVASLYADYCRHAGYAPASRPKRK
ncbi:MAG TPA: hypothetical protein VNG69_18960 [Casimicrobiaceae bacterium]|nr:hypothetical protein [Casimicrobiaceae bacterium]